MEGKTIIEKDEKKQTILVCENCSRELDEGETICTYCDEKLKNETHSLATVPAIILIIMSISIGIFIVWDIIFMDFSGSIINICEIDLDKSYKLDGECIKPTYNYEEKRNLSYAIEIFSEKTKRIEKINFSEYPILFNKDSYKRLFKNLSRNDKVTKKHFSPYYVVNDDTYVLIGSPLQIILLASLFILFLPIILPKFVKDFIRDNKHLGRIGKR